MPLAWPGSLQHPHDRVSTLILRFRRVSGTVKEIFLLFLGSAAFTAGLRFLVSRQRDASRRASVATRVPRDQRVCFRTLAELLGPTCAIDCQIPLPDLFEVRPERGRQPLYRRIAGLRLDFLLADAATGLPLCGVALDDHLPRHPSIDRLFAAHDLLLLRVPREQLADAAALRASIARLNRPAPRHSPPRSGARDSG